MLLVVGDVFVDTRDACGDFKDVHQSKVYMYALYCVSAKRKEKKTLDKVNFGVTKEIFG